MAWGWPADDPGHTIIYNVMAGPRKDGFDLMLIRIGPVKNPGADTAKPKVLPTPFQGIWNLENREHRPGLVVLGAGYAPMN